MGTERDDLTAVGAAVRRFLAVRVRDSHLVDDLTQEALLRLERSERQLTPDEQRAYAVVTARNLLASHHRRQSVQRRHAHRLVDRDGDPADPEQRAIAGEETAALASALTRLDPDDRDLLVRHEVTGTDLATLAEDADVSRGAIAMRLARARATLRLEFLLVFRRQSLPTERCRPVLLALAAGDRRRQAQLAAGDHLDACPTCAELLEPMTERDRRVAAWLLLPLGGIARRTKHALRSWWVGAVTAVVLLGALGGLIALRGRSGDPAGDATLLGPPSSASVAPSTVPTPAVAAAPAPAPPSTAAPPAVSPPPVAAPASSSPADGPTAAAEVVDPAPTAPATEASSACPPPRPLSELDPAGAIGCPFAVSVVTVVSLAGGEIVASAGPRSVAVHVPGAAVPVTVLPGTQISIVGTLDAAQGPRDLAVSVDAADITVAG